MTLGFSLRKQEIFDRHERIRRSGISPMQRVYEIHKMIDPDFTETIKHNRKMYLRRKEDEEYSETNQQIY